MNKDNKNCNTCYNELESRFDRLKKGYDLLDGTPHKSRKKLCCERVDEMAQFKKGYKHWKYKFLDPQRNINENIDEQVKIMEGALMWTLQEQADDLENRLEESLILINEYKNEPK